MNKKRSYDWMDVAVIATFIVFFGFLWIVGEPLYLSDTYQHENQFVTREPVYALLIQLIRTISPKYQYEWLVAIQNLLAMFAHIIFVLFLRKRFSIKNIWMPVVVFVVLTPHILTPIGSASHMIITNSLLSEGISFSLYLFFIIYLLRMLDSEKIIGRDSLIALGWALFLSMVRGQMMTLLLVWFLVLAVKSCLQKKYRKLLWLGIILIASFLSRGLLIKTYNYCEQGLFVSTAAGKAMSVANVLYVAEREDGEAIEDEQLRNFFYEIYDAAYQDEMLAVFSPSGLMARAKHHEECHDTLNFDYFGEAAKLYVRDTKGIYLDEFQQLMVEVDEVASVLQRELMPEVLLRYAYNYVSVIAMGFVRSVAIVHPLLNWYALIIYIVAVILMCWLLKKNKKSKAAIFMAVVLLMIVGNVTATSLMIQCISRYMIYNLPLFYLAGMFMLIESWQIIRKK